MSYQLSLDFHTGGKTGFRGDLAFLSDRPELGIGKITAVEDDSYILLFPDESSLAVEKNSEFLELLTSRPGALFEKEVNPGKMELALTAFQLKLTHLYDKLSALSNSRTRLLPHQIESTYVVANSLKPRFILADEVGLGKTIEAALIMKELIFRRGYKKVLIVAPSPLLIQWQQELKNKFNEEFQIVKKENFQEGNRHWKNYKKIITSIDFIKNPKYSEEILKTKWDIVIFDEAHRLRRDYHKITRGYLFAEKIARKTDCLLLLTATPFRGKLEELYYLVHLIDPEVLGNYHSFINDYIVGNKTDLREKISKILLRRRKVEVGGFTRRFAKTIQMDLAPDERQFYDETTDYVRREYNLAMNSANRAIGFVMVVFQKLLDSSTTALLSALTKRKHMLESRMHLMKSFSHQLDEWDLDETEDVEDFISDLELSSPQDLKNIKRELLSLNRLIMLGKKLKVDTKFNKLKETLGKLKKKGHTKFIIFTQFRSTQDYLVSRLQNEYVFAVFHGSLSADEKEREIEKFRNEADILIATEAGGEGRNLQFANVLFNYDLPWSPLKVEQRIGRIHRFGQKDNVLIFNFASKDTVADRILQVLTSKIQLFEDSIGPSDELLGTIQDELDFNSSFMKFVAGSKTFDEIDSEIENRIKIAREGFGKLNSLVTPRLVDFNLNDYYHHSLEERKYNNTHLEDLVGQFARYFPEKLALVKKDGFTYRMITDQTDKLATFDAETALGNDSLEFLAFGHPAIEGMIDRIMEPAFSRKYTTVAHPYYKNRTVFVFLTEYIFSLNRKELFFLEYDHKTGKVQNIEEPESYFEHITHTEAEKPNMEKAYILALMHAKEKAMAHIEALRSETHQVFQNEEYKMLVNNQKTIRHLEEKLMRQEAKIKWSGKSAGSVVTRTRNEITKVKEKYEQDVRKIKSDRNIKYTIDLFQTYIYE